jgi:TetR/AcrR family transcriptional repressor of bet genes
LQVTTTGSIKKARRDRSAGNEARRQHLIDATIESIAKYGFSRTTLSTVTSIAKTSHGIINFHFQSKDQLLLEAMKFLVNEHLTHWRTGLANASHSPAEQLVALISTDFDAKIIAPKRLAVWFAYLGEVNNRAEYREIADSKDRERNEQIKLLCEALKKSGHYAHVDSAVFATNLEAIIDGLWLHLLLLPKDISAHRAKQNCLTFLSSVFPKHFALSGSDQVTLTPSDHTQEITL